MNNNWSDRDILTLLKLRELGFSYEAIGERLGRKAISCKVKHNRVKRETDQSEAA